LAFLAFAGLSVYFISLAGKKQGSFHGNFSVFSRDFFGQIAHPSKK